MRRVDRIAGSVRRIAAGTCRLCRLFRAPWSLAGAALLGGLSGILLAGAAAEPAGPAAPAQESGQLQAHPRGIGVPGARLVRLQGVPTLEVDGAPFFVLGAQCDIWRSTRQDEKTVAFFEGYQAMNATAVSVGVPWARLEPAPDQYDFRFLDWFIGQARQRRLRLVVNLFNSNVCGKWGEGGSGLRYPPDYILAAPESYQRMLLSDAGTYHESGPPLCPNDPRTLERERKLCVAVAAHLASGDTERTVVLLQIDNEFYYQQWAKAPPGDPTAVRCHCRFCDEKWRGRSWENGEAFMFHSFAEYVRVLTDAITAVHPLPLYVNSPWWPPHVVPIFLDRCPNLSLVGVDGVSSPREPNMLSRSQVGRNIPFAAENPTENPETRENLDVLPYYSLIGQQGIGNLLWECGPPHTVVGDAGARQRYGNALYPLRWAQVPIARARGTTNLLGWYLIRDIAANLTTDVFGNFVPVKETGRTVVKDRLFVRDGLGSRVVNSHQFEATLGDLRLNISGSSAGILVRTAPNEVVLAIPSGRIVAQAPRPIHVVEGRFELERWLPQAQFGVQTVADASVLEVREPKVLRLSY